LGLALKKGKREGVAGRRKMPPVIEAGGEQMEIQTND
jgi:hypothetical protein